LHQKSANSEVPRSVPSSEPVAVPSAANPGSADHRVTLPPAEVETANRPQNLRELLATAHCARAFVRNRSNSANSSLCPTARPRVFRTKRSAYVRVERGTSSRQAGDRLECHQRAGAEHG
jgi:hypothetical protein